jgi:CBS domain-containing membrane protein
MIGSTIAFPMLVAPMGASAVLLFALPSSPLAQPWSIIGGNLVSAALGVTCAQWISDPMLASAVAIAAAIGAMMALRCIHPPSGAVALTAVLGGPAIHAQGYHFLWTPIGINSLLLLAVAMLFNNLTRHRYPHRIIEHTNTHHTADAQPGARLGFNSDDLDYVLAQYNEILDVSRDDLESLLLQAEMHAYRRRFGEITCADIMSRDVITVEFGTELQDAWTLMQQHDVKALPVISSARHVIGIVTFADFAKHAGLNTFQDFDTRMRLFLKRTGLVHSEKPEVVGQIMTRHVHTATDSMHIVELVNLLSNQGLRHIPIINKDKRLVGIVTNSDLVAGLYRGRIINT